VLQEYGTYILGEGGDDNDTSKRIHTKQERVLLLKIDKYLKPNNQIGTAAGVFPLPLFQKHRWYVVLNGELKELWNPSAHQNMEISPPRTNKRKEETVSNSFTPLVLFC